MSQAEEDYIRLMEPVGEHQVSLAHQVAMHLSDRHAGGGAADDRFDLHVGVAEQDA